MTADEMLDALAEVSRRIVAGTSGHSPGTYLVEAGNFALNRLSKGDGNDLLAAYNATCTVATDGGLTIPLVKQFSGSEHRRPLIVEEMTAQIIHVFAYIHANRQALEARRRDVHVVATSCCLTASVEGELPVVADVRDRPILLEKQYLEDLDGAFSRRRFNVSMSMLNDRLETSTYELDVDDGADLAAVFEEDILPEQRERQARHRDVALAFVANDR